MFWRRKTDGFVWHEHVRTTIKLRREDRARRIEELKQAAQDGAKAANEHAKAAGREGVRAGRSGLYALGQTIVRTAKSGATAAGHGAQWLATALLSATHRLFTAAQGALRDGLDKRQVWSIPARISARTKIASLFGVLGSLAAMSAYLQYVQTGWDWSAILAALVAVLLLIMAAAPWLRNVGSYATSFVGRLRVPSWLTRARVLPGGARTRPQISFNQTLPRWAPAAIAVVLATGLGLWGWQSGTVSRATAAVGSWVPSLSLPALPSIAGNQTLDDITGRARAVTGDTIRIAGRIIHLNGIEAPEIGQVCKDKRGRAWRCGRRARASMRRLVRRQRVVCSDVAKSSDGRISATCRAGDRNLAEEVTRQGYAFAEGGFFKTYAGAESDAQAASRGIWQGETQRPADFRAKRWAAASANAPDGCPIKGRVVRKAKIYVLPWESEYRRVRVRQRRGERWFCSEAEAANAGFRPASNG